MDGQLCWVLCPWAVGQGSGPGSRVRAQADSISEGRGCSQFICVSGMHLADKEDLKRPYMYVLV